MSTRTRKPGNSIPLLALAMVLLAACGPSPAAPPLEPATAPPTATLAYAPTIASYNTIIGSPSDSLVKLAELGTVHAQISAVSIDSMTLHLTSYSAADETVSIPPGTYFVAQNPATQNMVVRHSYRGTIPAGGTLDVTLDIACANLHLAEPTEKDTFTLSRLPSEVGLQQVLYALDRSRLSYPVEQAAIWIVSDNATYDQLGMLTGDSRSGPSLIGADEAVRAMQIIDKARVKLAKYAIWYERDQIGAAVTAPELKDWLITRAAQMTPGDEISQFAAAASASSEIGEAGGLAGKATGQPDATDCQDAGAAWSSAHDQPAAVLQLVYRKPVIPSKVVIHHILNADAVAAVELVDIVGNRHAVYQGEPAVVHECPYKMSIDVTGVKAPVAYIEVFLQQETTGWDQIDAVELIGQEP